MSDRFDQNIKSRIYSLESDVPDQMWDAIELRLRPKKDRRRFLLILLPLLAILSFLLINYNPKSESSDPTVSGFHASTISKLTGTTEGAATSAITEGAVQDLISGKDPVSVPAHQEIDSRVSVRQNKRSLTLSQWQEQAIPARSVLEAISREPANSSPGEIEETPVMPVTSSVLQTLNLSPSFILKDPKIEICPSFSSKVPLRPFFELALTGGVPVKMLSNQDRELDAYKNLRERTEQERTSLTINGLVGLEIGDRLEIKTGLSSTRIFEVFDYVDETATRTITNIITDTIFVNGEPRIRTDTSIVTQYGQRIKLSQNRLTSLDLPFLAAYKFNIQQHRFFLQAGGILNLALWTKGDLLDPEENIISIDSGKASSRQIFARHTGFELTAAMGYELELNEVNRLRILCSLRQSIGDYSSPQYPISQRYKQIHLGISWKHQL